VVAVVVVETHTVHLAQAEQQDLAVVEQVEHKIVIMQQQEQVTPEVVVAEVVKTILEKMVVVV
jgi:hypothetical protein